MLCRPWVYVGGAGCGSKSVQPFQRCMLPLLEGLMQQASWKTYLYLLIKVMENSLYTAPFLCTPISGFHSPLLRRYPGSAIFHKSIPSSSTSRMSFLARCLFGGYWQKRKSMYSRQGQQMPSKQCWESPGDDISSNTRFACDGSKPEAGLRQDMMVVKKILIKKMVKEVEGDRWRKMPITR